MKKQTFCRLIAFWLVLSLLAAIPAFAVEGDLDVLPDWDTKAYRVTYHLNGGVNHPSNPATFYKDTALSFAAPTKEGYTFGGWYADRAFNTPMPGIVAGTATDLQVYAMWCKIFADVPQGAWYKPAVDQISARGIIVGTGNGFNPDGVTTRAMVAQILYSMEGSPAVEGKSPYSDVGNSWYTNAVVWATRSGVVSGVGEGRFAPNEPITREQLAAMLWRYADRPTPAQTTLSFADAEEVSPWATQALCWAAEQKILQGYNNRVSPKNTATRAEAAQMIYKFIQL